MTLAVSTRREPYPPMIVRSHFERIRHRPVLEQALDTQVPAEKHVAELREERLIGELFCLSLKRSRPLSSKTDSARSPVGAPFVLRGE
jgi:hypothetical protein